jgi:hypothetical protein
MFLMEFANLREQLLQLYTLVCIGDFDRGAFEDIPDEVVSVSVSILGKIKSDQAIVSLAHCPTAREDKSRDSERTSRKRAATIAQEGMLSFCLIDLQVVPGWPLIYWWGKAEINAYSTLPLTGDQCKIAKGVATCNDIRFLLMSWEIKPGIVEDVFDLDEKCYHRHDWISFVNGARGEAWIDEPKVLIRWRLRGGQLFHAPKNRYGRGEDFYFKRGIAFSQVGNSFLARTHSIPSIIGNKGSSVYSSNWKQMLALMNSTRSRSILSDLNPGVGFELVDVKRLPVFNVSASEIVWEVIDNAYDSHSLHLERSASFLMPGPSPWRRAQDWAQQAVDRPEGAPLPVYVEELDSEPATGHLSFALGVAIGRFAPVDEQGQPTTSNPAGILDPASADLSHALPAGILFLDGSLAETDLRDGLGHPAAQQLHHAWARYGPAIATNRNLRDWLRLDFFKDVHKGMYENRPIHWPLSSASKTFVAWVNIHRMDGQTLRLLLADHLIDGSLKRIEGEIDDLRSSVEGGDAKAVRLATKRLNYLLQARDELKSFIAAVQECADQGPPPPDARCKQRAVDAPFDPDLDDGVMINSASLWPLLDPQWKDPKKWWKELATAAGRKDYDWAHLAMRYWPDRVDQKCQNDPSLGVAHGCFWRYHPARAWAWELRLQEEISSDFKIDEAPYRPGGRELGDAGDGPHRAAWLADHPEEALVAVEKEAIRRMGRGNNRKLVAEMTILEPGLWSALPRQVWDMELRLGERQGSEFRLIAPDEAEAREQLLEAHPHLATDRRAFLQGLAPQGELAVVLEDDETQEELEEIE